MAIEQQHIITDKTLIRAAKAVSVIFTPFSIPFIPDSIRVFVPADHAAAIQVNRTGSGVLLYNPYAYPDHLPFP